MCRSGTASKFGEILAGEIHAAEFKLKNDGDAPLKVSQEKGCCGAEAALSPMRLEPGACAKLTVMFKPMVPGAFSKEVRLYCDVSDQPVVVIPVTGSGFVITLLDALCTGQVYVPVLALIAREPGAWRAFALLVVYNLAFISPLVAVFLLASKTTDAFQMAQWSSRNVIPAKIASGLVFAVLGILVLVV